MSTDPTSVVKDWTDAINRHDTDAAVTYLSNDSVFSNTGSGQRFVGVAENRVHYDELFTVWPDVRFEIVKLFSAGEYYVKEWIMTGVHRGDLPGLPANDHSFRILGAGVGVVRNGKIAEATEYWNFATLLAQIGPVHATVG
jgi:steroid delta-isomerase-like uncharacterized protein